MSKPSVALIYVRVSRFTAEDEGRKVSPETQLEKCQALPALKGCAIERFEDLDYSGKNTKRPGFIKLMERAQRGDVALVACYSVSRLSRSVADLYSTLQRLQDLGIGFVSATEPIETATPMGRAFLGILAVLAQLEREQTAQRVTDALAFKRSQGKVLGPPPAGYTRRADGGLAIDERPAATVRLIFEHYGSGNFSYRKLADWLNRQGINPIAVRARNGAPPATLWSADTLKEIVTRATYAGLVATPEGLHPGDHPAIIPMDVWQRCSALRTKQRPGMGRRPPRHRSSPFPLTSLLRCAECGSTMRGRPSGRPGRITRYYACSAQRRYGTCQARAVPAAVLEADLVDWLSRCHPGDEVENEAREILQRGLRQKADC